MGYIPVDFMGLMGKVVNAPLQIPLRRKDYE